LVEAAPKVDRRDIGGLTFMLPAGWKFDQPAGQDHAMLTYADSTRYCIVSLYRPIASDDIAIDFLREWKAIAGTIKDQEPNSARRRVGGRDVIEATGTVTVDDGTVVFERVGVIMGNGHISAMIVLTANETTHQACQPDADAMYASITFDAAAAAAPVPGNALLGTMKSSITSGDLSGSWGFGASVVPGSNEGASFVGMSYTFHADGTYEYRESGRSNGSTFKETYPGTFTLSGGNLVLKGKDGREQTKQLIAFMDTPDAAAVLTLYTVNPSRSPLDAAAIAKQCYVKNGVYQCTDGELWSRAAPGAKKTK
jgi:hypothetical protein